MARMTPHTVSESQAPDRTNHAVFIALTVMSAQALSVFHGTGRAARRCCLYAREDKKIVYSSRFVREDKKMT